MPTKLLQLTINDLRQVLGAFGRERLDCGVDIVEIECRRRVAGIGVSLLLVLDRLQDVLGVHVHGRRRSNLPVAFVAGEHQRHQARQHTQSFDARHLGVGPRTAGTQFRIDVRIIDTEILALTAQPAQLGEPAIRAILHEQHVEPLTKHLKLSWIQLANRRVFSVRHIDSRRQQTWVWLRHC